MPDPARSMSFWEHLAELRTRLARAALWVTLASCAAYWYKDAIYDLLLHPLTLSAPGLKLNYFSPTEPFFVYLRLAIYTGLVIASPVVLWELWCFVAPGLTPRERRSIRPILPVVLSLFAGGVVFVYYMLLPISLKVLLGIAGPQMQPTLSQEHYISFVLGLCMSGGLLFELPIVLGVLGWLGIVNARWLWRYSAHALIVLMIVAAVITPSTDAFTMMALTVPLMGLYLASIGLVAVVQPKAP